MLGAILLNALDAVDVDLFLLSWLKGVMDDVEEEEGRSTSAEAILERRMFPKVKVVKEGATVLRQRNYKPVPTARATAQCSAKNNQE